MFREKTKLEIAKEELEEISLIWVGIILFWIISSLSLLITIPKINLDKNLLFAPIIIIQSIIIMILHVHRSIITEPLFPIFYLIIQPIIGFITLWSLRNYYQAKKKAKFN